MAQLTWLGEPLWHEGDKIYYSGFKMKKETFLIGDCVLMRPATANEKPYVGRIEALFDRDGTKCLISCWFFYPEDTIIGRQDTDGDNEVFVSPQRAENPLNTVLGKCHILSYEQFRAGFLPRGEAPVFFTRRIYNAEREEFDDIMPYHHIEAQLQLDSGHTIEKIIGKMMTDDGRTRYFVTWKGLSSRHNCWIDAADFETEPNHAPRFPLRFRLGLAQTKRGPQTGRVPLKSDKWDLGNVVSISEPVYNVPIPEKPETIEIPMFSEVPDYERPELPNKRGTPRNKRRRSDEDQSSSEDTSDANYERLHDMQNEKLLKLIERARSEAESVRRETQRRRDQLDTTIHYDRTA